MTTPLLSEEQRRYDLIALAIQGAEDPDAAVVLSDAMHEMGVETPKLAFLLVAKFSEVEEFIRATKEFAGSNPPMMCWARACLSVWLFEGWSTKPWPLISKIEKQMHVVSMAGRILRSEEAKTRNVLIEALEKELFGPYLRTY
jgi:hypothetical protein